jgi:diguanylate cyclase (GGDEF)-like protein
MQVLPWFDNRTLITCDLLLATIFAIVFISTQRVYPHLRGVRSIATGFLLGIPGAALLAFRGNIPYFLSVVVGSGCVLGSFLALYRGILRFLESRRLLTVPWAASVVTMAVIYYFSQVQQDIVPRIVMITMTIGLIRALTAMALLDRAASFPNPKTMQLFGWTMAFFAAVNVICGLATIAHGVPPGPLSSTLEGTVTLVLGMVSNCTTGLFVLILYSSELIARGREESQKDELSGAFNRRGIEAKLAAELKQFSRGKQKLSVALIDVDHFKSINDGQGHAAGDAALREVAELITSRLRGRDYLGRYGGDEFLLILPGTAASIAMVIAERLSTAVNGLRFGVSGRLTLSMGVTEAFLGDDRERLIARADKALYRAKSDGRNCRRLVLPQPPAPPEPEAPNSSSQNAPAPLGSVLRPRIESPLTQQ